MYKKEVGVFQREIEPGLENLASKYPVVTIMSPRQSGHLKKLGIFFGRISSQPKPLQTRIYSAFRFRDTLQQSDFIHT